ncbi:T9SS type B sorting domain-containing protein [Flavivirga spongiicola]|uniref:T9SS type B sorting domain-containing protein n=1 Tax=Flavivirga spongiicola TaxID=421621 RepID=A0ABU7XNV5_9FLAO|nr:T9SS type B sorting domain-containing protein [Flavivirga sp. MEBiC05379]MDO5977449.1 T9SS type B sorting domain-containing protein [Flavivirga sp. MEBiC05379]
MKYILKLSLFLFAYSALSQTCQTIDLQLDSYSPAKNASGIIRVCVNQTITLEGSATFSSNSTGAIYEWDLGDGNTIAGTTASFSYTTPGVYIANLRVKGTTPTRCTTSKNIDQVIQVSTEPTFSKTEARDTVLCFGESTTIEGHVNTTKFDDNCTPPVGSNTVLPDGNGVSYETSVFVDCFNSGETLSNINQLKSICLNMEHSFVGDLHIDIISPSGQTVRILSSQGGITANFGHPWADGHRGDNTGNLTPGIGSEYCIVPDNSLPTLKQGIVSGGIFTLENGPGTYIDDYVPAGNYRSENPLNGLVGSPLNGQWKIRIIDNIGGDNGTIFSWSIDFDPSILPVDYSFTPSIVSETWDVDASIINTSGNDIIVQPTTAGTHCYTYRVVDDFGCEYTKEVCIEMIREVLVTSPPIDIFNCDVGSDGIEVFDFANNKNLVLGSQPASEVVVSFHPAEADARDNKGALPTLYTNTLITETIWVRIADLTQTCFEIASFNINVVPIPIANQPVDYELCDDGLDGSDINGKVLFNLSTKTNEVLGGQSGVDFAVKFYDTENKADVGVLGTEIIGDISNTTNSQPIYARIENRLNNTCYDTTSFNLIVHPLPIVTPVVELKQCDDDSDGRSLFNLTEANQLISTDYLNETFTYYLSDAQAKTGLVTDQITNFIAYQNPTPITGSSIYARIETANGCYRTSRVNLVVGVSQIPASFNTLEYYICDDKQIDNDNTNGIAAFDFSDAEQKIKDIFPLPHNFTVTFYNNEADALAEINPIVDISNHRNEGYPNIQNIYVRLDSDAVNACLGLGHHITLNVDSLPIKNTIVDYILCSDTNEATFDLSTKLPEVIGTQTRPIIVTYHESKQDAIDNNPITTTPNTYLSEAKTIYVRAQFDDNNDGILDPQECVSTDMSFNLVVSPNPVIFTPDPIRICNNQVDTFYDLTVREDQITGGDTSIVLQYFKTQTDLDTNNSIADPTQFNNALLDNTVLVLATGTNTCTSVITMELKTIIYDVLNVTPTPIEECEIDNNGFDNFDVRRREIDILNGLNPLDFDFFYYEQETDAIAGNNNAIQTPGNFINTVKGTQTIYVNVKPKANECSQVVPITLIVNPVPEIGIEDEYVICLSANSTSIPPVLSTFLANPPIDTKLNIVEYSFQWYKDKEGLAVNLIAGATGATYTPTEEGDYTVIATNRITGCTIPATTLVIGSYPPERITIELGSDAFSGNNILEVTVTGNGDYEYQLDSGEWQRENRFENVPGGTRTVYVRDLYNCDKVSAMQIVIDYPKYFTPNGDGINDTWNIRGIATQPNAKIYIYDRYGKLLKQLSPINSGWDGTFNGKLMPTNGYWFTVEYTEPRDDVIRVFKAHFTLKK